MAVKIGHASLDEQKRTKNGAAGDQTGAEVCTRTWYSKPWTFVLRPRRMELAQKSARACEQACANGQIGYDQNQRNTLYTQAKKKGFDLSQIAVSCECDCSALMHVCALAGGADIPYGTNGATTSTMKSRFTANQDYEVLTDSKYLTSALYLKRGDILVRPGSHTVMVLEDGAYALGQSGCVQGLDGYTQEQFVRDVQAILGANVDGKGGPETLSKTITVSMFRNRKHALVTPLERYMKALGFYTGEIEADVSKQPCFGNGMKAAVKQYQKDVVKASKKNQDGVISAGKRTWKCLLGLC